MAESRLSSLGILSIVLKRSKALNLDDFVKRFANRHIQLL